MRDRPRKGIPAPPVKPCEPAIGDQLIGVGDTVLIIRNNTLTEATFRARMFNSMAFASHFPFLILFPSIVDISDGFAGWQNYVFMHLGLALITWLMFMPFMLLSAWQIKRTSHTVFNRKTRKVYQKEGKKLWIGEWDTAFARPSCPTNRQGGKITERPFGPEYLLEINFIDPRQETKKIGEITLQNFSDFRLLIPSNRPRDPDETYAREVHEALRVFMNEGPEHLPVPLRERIWWDIPHHELFLTPSQAWRRYAPWRTGNLNKEEHTQRAGTRLFWYPFFPYNIYMACCWWAVCKILNVRTAEIPEEALEGSSGWILDRVSFARSKVTG